MPLYGAPLRRTRPRPKTAAMPEAAPEAAIEIRDLVKEYAAHGDAPPKLALKGVSFDVPEGGIFGLLGPNGAGKSTLINIMAGLVMKTSGQVTIWGHDIDRDHRNAKMSIGIVPQEIVFDPFFTPFEVLENQSGLYGIARHLRRSEELLRAVHLGDKRDAYSRSLSGGMKRRLLRRVRIAGVDVAGVGGLARFIVGGRGVLAR